MVYPIPRPRTLGKHQKEGQTSAKNLGSGKSSPYCQLAVAWTTYSFLRWLSTHQHFWLQGQWLPARSHMESIKAGILPPKIPYCAPILLISPHICEVYCTTCDWLYCWKTTSWMGQLTGASFAAPVGTDEGVKHIFIPEQLALDRRKLVLYCTVAEC